MSGPKIIHKRKANIRTWNLKHLTRLLILGSERTTETAVILGWVYHQNWEDFDMAIEDALDMLVLFVLFGWLVCLPQLYVGS